jgi:hypothetical protein
MEEIVLQKYKWENFTLEEFADHNPIPCDFKWQRGYTANLAPSGQEPEIYTFNRTKRLYETTEKEWIKKSVNLFCSARVSRVTLILSEIIENGKPIKLRVCVYYFTKERKVGKRYFWKKANSVYYTVNLKQKNFYVTKKNKSGRHTNTTTTKNPIKFFKRDESLLNGIFLHLNIPTNFDNSIIPYVELGTYETDAMIMKQEVETAVDKILSKFKNRLEVKNIGMKCDLYTILCKWFINKRKIKVPNNWKDYMRYYYPGIKELKKHNNKLIQTILSSYGLKSKSSISLLHTNDFICLDTYKIIKDLVGKHNISKINTSLFKDEHLLGLSNTEQRFKALNLSKKEIKNIINLLNDIAHNGDPYVLRDFIADHISMREQLKRKTGKTYRIKADTIKLYNNEHSKWSTKLSEIRKGENIEYLYDNNFIKIITSPYTDEVGQKFIIKLLKTGLDYTEEGLKQKNCVATYIDKFDRCIISVRTMDDERVTLEYVIPHEHNPPKLIQARGKLNTIIPDKFNKVVHEITQRFLHIHNTNIWKPTQIEVNNLVTGLKEIKEVSKPLTIKNDFLLYEEEFEDLPF